MGTFAKMEGGFPIPMTKPLKVPLDLAQETA